MTDSLTNRFINMCILKKYDNFVGCYLRKRYESAKILSEKEFKEELDHVLFDSETYR